MKLEVKYFDQNEDFASLLPRSGSVEATPSCSDSSHTWYFLCLDEPLVYEDMKYSHFLLASRGKIMKLKLKVQRQSLYCSCHQMRSLKMGSRISSIIMLLGG
jgi:hypothetical protein